MLGMNIYPDFCYVHEVRVFIRVFPPLTWLGEDMIGRDVRERQSDEQKLGYKDHNQVFIYVVQSFHSMVDFPRSYIT